jgi:hypothetical protein
MTEETSLNMPLKVQHSPTLTLRVAARRFAACAKGDDVHVEDFAEATEQMMTIVERFGSFTSRGVADVRQNLRRVREKARKGKARIARQSMRAFLADELRRGGIRPGGGPTSRSGAEALLWARLVLSFWVEIFDEHVRRPQGELRDETSRGFKRTLSRYLDSFSRAAFSMAFRQAPDWSEVRESLGCSGAGACSDAAATEEMRHFVKDVRPVLERMTALQKESGLEDPRTP